MDLPYKMFCRTGEGVLEENAEIKLYVCSGQYQMGQVMQKRVLCHMGTTKVQISLCIRAVWSAPLLFAAYIVWDVY